MVFTVLYAVACCVLRVTCCVLRVASCELRVASCVCEFIVFEEILILLQMK